MTPASTSPTPKSSVVTVATIPLLANPEFLACALIPFTGISSGPVEAVMTSPPGHMQKV